MALAVVRRPADAEDVAQDAFVLALSNLDACREEARFGGWLLTIVRNQAKNRLSWRKLRDVPRDPTSLKENTDATSLNVAATRRDLLRALDGLNVAHREVVLLHDLEGWTHSEIAEVLGISDVMSRQHLFLARRQLRDALEGVCETKEAVHE
jgi:RNA polymerase sigma-70 factor (ECF subfamily)